jgi:MarR family
MHTPTTSTPNLNSSTITSIPTLKSTARSTPRSKPRKLTKQQHKYLMLIYKFRFVTVELLASHLSVNRSAVQRSLVTLQSRGYITRRYSTEYRMSGRYAEYCLDLGGIRYLRKTLADTYPEELFRPMYKDRTCTDEFVQKCLLLFRIYLKLRAAHGAKLSIYTSSEIRQQGDCPRPLPGLYIQSIEYEDTDWFLDVFLDPLFFYIKKRIQLYVAHYETYEWEGATYPTVILVVPNERLQKKATRYIAKYLDERYLDDGELVIVAITLETLEIKI